MNRNDLPGILIVFAIVALTIVMAQTHAKDVHLDQTPSTSTSTSAAPRFFEVVTDNVPVFCNAERVIIDLTTGAHYKPTLPVCLDQDICAPTNWDNFWVTWNPATGEPISLHEESVRELCQTLIEPYRINNVASLNLP